MANPRTSNSRLLAIGFAVLVVGVVLVLLIIRNTDDSPAEPSPVATERADGADGDGASPEEEQTPLTPEQLSSARLPLPLDIPEGSEAVAVRVPFDRSVAAIPTPGDLVNLYRHLAPGAQQDGADGQQDPTGEGEDGTPVARTTSSLPPRGPDAELVLPEVEVLAVTGPLPAANDGTVTAVLAIPSDEVAGLVPLANANELWFTLLPADEKDGTDEDATESSTEDPE